LYCLHDLVLDVPALIRRLAHAHQARIHLLNWQAGCQWQQQPNQVSLQIAPDLHLHARRFILAAGEGNADLLRDLSLPTPAMQRRPLHMLMVKHSHPEPVFLHCIEAGGSTPAMTITTHQHSDGDQIWYLGGGIAEQGVGLSPAACQHEAATKLQAWFPWINLEDAQWRSLDAVRAEPAQADSGRPDHPFVSEHQNVMVTWPVKLTLAPGLADLVMSSLATAAILPSAQPSQHDLRQRLAFPGYAKPPWEIAWS
jgi:hypothetical protein